MEDSRELTRREKTAIRALVTKWCANYDRELGCLPLECECFMLGKCWTGAYCRYFREAVLPLDPALEADLSGMWAAHPGGRQAALLLPGLWQNGSSQTAAGTHEAETEVMC